MLEEKLIKIGFNKKETKIYLELLKIGPQPVSIVAKRLQYNRTTSYSILRGLERKGLVSSYKNFNLKVFVACDPNSLIAYLDSKSKTFDYYKREFLSLIPKFRAFFKNYSFKKPIVRYFDGVEGVKHVMYDALSAKSESCAYLCLDKWFQSEMKDFLIEYRQTRISNSKISFRAIVPNMSEARDFMQSYVDDGVEVDCLYVDSANAESLFTNEMTIYDDKVTILNLTAGEEFGVIIESPEIARMQRSIFSMAWKGLKT